MLDPDGRFAIRVANVDYVALEKELRSAPSLPVGTGILAEFLPSRDNLERMSRHLGLPVSSKERVEKLKLRILGATIGFRLRSEAIRGDRDVSEHRGQAE